MAGILNAKHRVIDAIITQEGRRQVAAGDLQIKYVTFTDRHTFYESSGSNNVAADAGDAGEDPERAVRVAPRAGQGEAR